MKKKRSNFTSKNHRRISSIPRLPSERDIRLNELSMQFGLSLGSSIFKKMMKDAEKYQFPNNLPLQVEAEEESEIPKNGNTK